MGLTPHHEVDAVENDRGHRRRLILTFTYAIGFLIAATSPFHFVEHGMVGHYYGQHGAQAIYLCISAGYLLFGFATIVRRRYLGYAANLGKTICACFALVAYIDVRYGAPMLIYFGMVTHSICDGLDMLDDRQARRAGR